MAKVTASTSTNSTSVRADHLGYLIDSSSSSKSVIGRPVESFSNIAATDRIIKEACNISGAIQPSFQRLLLELPTDDDRLAVANFIIESYHDRNISVKTKCAYITCLVYLSRFCQNKKSFKDMTAIDIVTGYLNSLKRPFEADPDQRWIATYNLRASVFLKFFKWLTQPDLEVSNRQLDACPMLKGLRFVKRKGPKTHIKPTDLWTLEDDAIFVKYCEDARITCYHMMSRDTSARPGELLAIRIGDIKFKRATDNRMFAEVEIGRYGKTKKSRIVPLIRSLPYLKAWLAQHPQAGNPDAYLFVSFNHKSKYANTPLKPVSLSVIYNELHKKYFPKLLEKPDIISMQHDNNALQEDRIKVRALLKKPWNPYIRRHTALTEKAPLLKDFNLRQYAGWVKSSNMVEIYTHELGGESSEDLLMAYGIDVRASNKNETASQLALQAKPCPHCSEPNRPDAKFCLSCGMVLAIDEYNATVQSLQEAENAKKELAALKAKQEEDARKQQMDIEQMKIQLRNTGDQVGILLQMLSNIQKQEVNTGTAITQAPKDFVLKELGILTNGKIGQHPETGIVVESLDQASSSSSNHCFFCEQREKEENKYKHHATKEHAPQRLTKLSFSL